MELNNGMLNSALHEMKRALDLQKQAIDDLYSAINLAEKATRSENGSKDIQHNEN